MVVARYPNSRPRRARASDWRRRMVQETSLSVNDLIWPIFLVDGENITEPVASMPGVERVSPDIALRRVEQAALLDIPCVALFPYTDPALKTPGAEEAWNPENLVCRTTRLLKAEIPDIGIMHDVALDPYNSDGHDGLVSKEAKTEGCVLNDESVAALIRQSLVQAEAGADILGPSDMMDGRVGAIRAALEDAGHTDVLIMSYAAKYASSFYGPFRDAVGSGGALKGDKKTYQMNPANTEEALREVEMDIMEGADMVMVKPGMPYLDVCRRVKESFCVPTYAYQVSGEFAMIEAAAQNGWLDRRSAITESLQAFKRAGCDGVLTYFALEAAQWLADGEI